MGWYVINKSNNERMSNFELLRIFSMLMIVIHHVIVHSIASVKGSNDLLVWVADCFFIYGVNLFLLISGYFTIRLSWKSFINLMWIFFFYKFFHLCFESFVLKEYHSVFEWIAKPLGVPFSTGGWFTDTYVLLMLVSPLLNKILEYTDRKTYHYFLSLLVTINCVWGWGYGNIVNPIGYSLFHFILVYFIGYGLRHYFNKKINIIVWGAVFILIVVIINYWGLYFLKSRVFAYNNPFILLISCGIFLRFSRINHKSKQTNIIASSMIGVYLIHSQGSFSREFISIISCLYANEKPYLFAFYVFLLLLCLFVFTFILDAVRKRCVVFIVDRFSKKLDDICNRLINHHENNNRRSDC